MRRFLAAILVLLPLTLLAACAGLQTDQAAADKAKLHDDWAKLKTDFEAARPAIDAALAGQPAVLELIKAVSVTRDPVAAIFAAEKVYAAGADVVAKIKAAAPALEADMRAVRDDLRALAKDARGD
jgi:outer membrane murein-binding lipoprotein Lpp